MERGVDTRPTPPRPLGRRTHGNHNPTATQPQPNTGPNGNQRLPTPSAPPTTRTNQGTVSTTLLSPRTSTNPAARSKTYLSQHLEWEQACSATTNGRPTTQLFLSCWKRHQGYLIHPTQPQHPQKTPPPVVHHMKTLPAHQASDQLPPKAETVHPNTLQHELQPKLCCGAAVRNKTAPRRLRERDGGQVTPKQTPIPLRERGGTIYHSTPQ